MWCLMDFQNTFSLTLQVTSKYLKTRILTRTHLCKREHLFHKEKVECINLFDKTV